MTRNTLDEQIDLEREIVSACTLDTRHLDECLEAGLQPQHFASPSCGTVFSVCVRIYMAGLKVDPVTVLSTATREEKNQCGGRDGIMHVCSFDYGFEYQHLREKAKRVAEMYRFQRAAETVREYLKDPKKIPSAAEFSNVLQLAAIECVDNSDSQIMTMRQAAEIAEEKIRAVAEGELEYLMPTGFSTLDRFLGGFRAGQVYGLAGHAKGGKTTLGLQIADRIARSGTGAIVISLEMDETELAFKQLGWAEHRFADRISSGVLDAEALRMWRRSKDQVFEFSDNLHLVTNSDGKVRTIEAIVTRASRARSVRFALVDYLTLIQLPPGRDSHAVKLASVTARLKRLAAKTGTAILVLSQYNRNAFDRFEKGKNFSPIVSDIYGSSGLEKDSSALMLLDTPWSMTGDDPGDEAGVHVATNRNGPTGRCDLRRTRIGSFEDYAAALTAGMVNGRH